MTLKPLPLYFAKYKWLLLLVSARADASASMYSSYSVGYHIYLDDDGIDVNESN